MVRDYERWPGSGGTTARLTRQECDILAASARGLMASEVAAELGLGVADVRAGIVSAIQELGARSKLEAVIIALRRGDIVP
jgi:DNA-binding NarL/FixJ family response regulator